MKNEYAKAMDTASAAVSESRAGYRNTPTEEILFDIREHIGVLRKSNNGWTRELNVVCWNGSSPKFDIREWDPKHEKMTKGISFTKSEAIEICKWLTARNMEPVLPKSEPGPDGEVPF